MPTDRLFFALMPDAPAASQAEGWAQRMGAERGLKLRRGAREKFHITLFHVGDFVGWPQAVVDEACRVAAQVHAAPFEVCLNRLGSFAGSAHRRPYVLLCTEAAALNAFQAHLHARLIAAGLTQGRQHVPYTPHLTLLYGREPLAERSVAPLSWTVREFVLIRSFIGQGRHEHLGRWPLMGD
ncbi:MAG: RNA 2',3'-cyclic phosphodiesterase [Aquabacterium sp.]